MRSHLIASVLFALGAAAGADGAKPVATAGEARPSHTIRIYKQNPRYWQDKGKPVLLLGGTDDDNLFQWTGKKLTGQLDLLASVGGNYVRCTMSSRDPRNVWPFAKKGRQYDLNRSGDEYWKRFETFLAETARRDIIVQIELWDRFDFASYMQGWSRNPYNPRNNINYTSAASGLKEVIRTHPSRREMDVFTCEPHNALLARREPNEAYCLANPSKEYAVYFPNGGEVALDIRSLKQPAIIRWLDISAGKWAKPHALNRGQSVTLRPPAKGHWAALIRATVHRRK